MEEKAYFDSVLRVTSYISQILGTIYSQRRGELKKCDELHLLKAVYLKFSKLDS